jgi:DNA-binding XRE family transcriptional regulator
MSDKPPKKPPRTLTKGQKQPRSERDAEAPPFSVATNAPELLPVPIGEVLAVNLRVRRAELGWSQLELAEKSGVVRKQISLLERGLGNPKLDTLQTLARTFRCQVHELLTPRPRFIPIHS